MKIANDFCNSRKLQKEKRKKINKVSSLKAKQENCETLHNCTINESFLKPSRQLHVQS